MRISLANWAAQIPSILSGVLKNIGETTQKLGVYSKLDGPSRQMLQKLKPYQNFIRGAAQKYQVPEELLGAVIYQESHGNPKALSPKGAQGLMQLMPKTAKELGVKNPFNPAENIDGGAKYLSQMMQKFHGDTKLAVAAYNAGPGNVQKHGGIPPFAETQKYVSNVLGFAKKLEATQAFSQNPLFDFLNGLQQPSQTVSTLHQIEGKKVSTQEAFFEKYHDMAVETQRLTGIPASVTLAQAALESAWGKHAPGNNFFGIKGVGPAGSQKLWTHEEIGGKIVRVQANFRAYPSALESFMDHAKVISEGKYLKHAMEHTDSAESFITALQSGKSKYATDSDYASKIMKIIASHHLEQYDQI